MKIELMNRKNNFLIILLGLAASIIYFFPYLKTSNPETQFYGDLYMLYYPQFVEGFSRYSQGFISGIDFFTGNGASSYSLRANLPIFYPVYLALYFIIDLTSGKVGDNEMIFVFILHSFFCYFFTFFVCYRYFSLKASTSVMVALCYTFAISKWIYLTPFFYIAALFPSLLFAGFLSASSTNILKSLLCSVAAYLVFTSGYVPLAMHAVLLSIFLCYITLGYNNSSGEWKKPSFKVAVFLILPTIIATIVLSPYYLGMYQYQKLTVGLPNYVWYATSHFYYTWADFSSILSFGFPPDIEPAETPHVYTGLIIAFIFFAAVFNAKALKYSPFNVRFLSIIGFIVVVHLLLMTGSETGVPSLFYHLVPFLGEMHLYGRFFIVASFCLFLAAGILIQSMTEFSNDEALDLFRPLASLLIFILSVAIIRGLSQPYQDRLFFEVVLVALFALAWSQRLFTNPVVIAGLMCFLIQYGVFSVTLSNFKVENPPPHQNSLAFDKGRINSLAQFLKEHSNKDLIKYVDLTTSIEKFGGPPLNLPYLLRRQVNLSNYLGYEIHNSLEATYTSQGFSYFGKFNEDWLKFTDVDFVVFDEASKNANLDWFLKNIDNASPTLDLGYGYHISKVKQENDYGSYSNGIFKVTCSERIFDYLLDSNFSTYAFFEFNCVEGGSVSLQLFPNVNMTFKVNGDVVDLSKTMGNGSVLDLPPGRNTVSYRFSNNWIKIFQFSAWLYLILLLGVLLQKSLKLVRP